MNICSDEQLAKKLPAARPVGYIFPNPPIPVHGDLRDTNIIVEKDERVACGL